MVDQDKVFYSESRHLREKLDRIETESRKPREEKKEEKWVEQEKEEAPQREKVSRYFMINQSILCHRCKQAGHFQKNCIEDPVEEVENCLFCLQPHRRFECYNQICFNCQ